MKKECPNCKSYNTELIEKKFKAGNNERKYKYNICQDCNFVEHKHSKSRISIQTIRNIVEQEFECKLNHTIRIELYRNARRFFCKLAWDFGYTATEIAQALKRDRSTIYTVKDYANDLHFTDKLFRQKYNKLKEKIIT